MDTALAMDIAVGVVFLISAITKWGKGLYKCIMPLIVVVAAIIGAVILSNVLTPAVTEAIYPKVEDKVVANLQENLAELQDELNLSAEADVIGGKVKELIPEPLWKIGEKLGELEDVFADFAQKVGQSAAELLTAEQREKLQSAGVGLREEAEDVRVAVFAAAFETAYRLTETVVRWTIRILGFALLYLLLTLLKNALHFTVELPVIGWVDKLGGAMLGILECAAVLLVAGWLLEFFDVMLLHELSEGSKAASFFF